MRAKIVISQLDVARPPTVLGATLPAAQVPPQAALLVAARAARARRAGGAHDGLESNWQVATRHASANKVRHALRRWRVLSERLVARECKIVGLAGESMPADFIVTRKTDRKKVDYATNAKNAVPSAPAKAK